MQDEYQALDFSYWKEVKKEVSGILREVQHHMLLVHNSAEFKELVDFMNRLATSGTVLYISLNKTYSSMQPFFKDCRADIYVVDCVSVGVFGEKEQKECIFTKAPDDFIGMTLLVQRMAEKVNHSFLIIDAISQFVDFTPTGAKDRKFTMFLDDLKKIEDAHTSKGILLYGTPHLESLIIPTLLFDVVIKMNVLKDKVYWV